MSLCCTCCGCKFDMIAPVYTYHSFVDAPSSVPLYIINSLYYPFAYRRNIHEKTINDTILRQSKIINICSRNCMLLIENYIDNQTDDGSSKKARCE